MKINNLHDKLFRSTFSHIREVIILIENFLPKDLVERLDLTTLKNENTSFVNKHLQEYFSDLIYSCNYGKRKNKVLISLLLEHKSYVVNPYPQLMRYLVEGYEYQVQQYQKAEKKDKNTIFSFNVILPIIVYHGKQKWEYKSFIDYFDHGDDRLIQRYIPKFGYQLIDLAGYTKEEIFAIEVSFALTTLQLLKHRQNADFLLQHYRELFIFVENDDNKGTISFTETVVLYMLQGYGVEKPVVDKMLNDLPDKAKKSMLTAYESLIQEGLVKGIEQGMKKGFEQGLEKGLEQGLEKGLEQGLEKGLEQGLEKGLQQGKQRGEAIGAIKSRLTYALDFMDTFSDWTDNTLAQVAKVSPTFIKKLRKAIATKKESEVVKVARELFKKTEEYKAKNFKKIDQDIKSVLEKRAKTKNKN